MRISYSGLDTFNQCPAKYKFQYIDKIKTSKSKDAVFGTLIHDCLKYFHNPSLSVIPSEDELLKYFTNKWDSSFYPDKQEEAFAFHNGVEILKNYYRQNQSQRFNIVNLEVGFGVSILDQGYLHEITGRIDRIDKLEDGSFEVIDYKTTKKMPAQKDVDNDWQLSIYYLGVMSRWPNLIKENRPVKLSLYYLKHGEKLSTRRQQSAIGETKNKIIAIINKIKKSDFSPRPNPLCDWCSYQPYCSFFMHKFKKPEINDLQIKNVIKEYFLIKNKQTQDNKKMAELKDLINDYCDKNGLDRIFGDEGFITRLSQQRFVYNLEIIKSVLEPLGKWQEVLAVDAVKLKKALNSLPLELREKIEQGKLVKKEFKVITATVQKIRKTT